MNESLRNILKQSKRIAFLGGAGISTESGIPDFRSSDGIYKAKKTYGVPPEILLSHDFFENYPELFYDYYKKNLIYPNAEPNRAHLALAKLEREGKLSAVITQNIDNLHQRAGSKNVLELHGSVYRNYCTRCRKFHPVETILASDEIPYCECGGIIKPDVVLYEEGLDQQVISGAVSAISQADTLIIGGTSLVVYPAAGLIDYFHGSNLVVINRDPTPRDAHADLLIQGKIGEVLGAAVEGM